jgi:hypothetical protein
MSDGNPRAVPGDNSKKATPQEEMATGVAIDRLRSLVERIERLEEERKALGSDIKDIYTEAKTTGLIRAEYVTRARFWALLP